MKTFPRFAAAALALVSASSGLVAAGLVSCAYVSTARADEPAPKPLKSPGPEEAKPIVGKAPVDEPKPEVAAKTAESPGKVFDASELGEPDKASEELIKGVEDKCTSEPRSREGMSPAQEKRCNLAVSKLVQRGVKAAPTILAKLDDENDFSHYYARTRLYYALGKMDDPKVEDVLVRGYARIATKRLDGYSNDISMIESALVTLNAADPAGASAIGQPDVTDQWASAEEHVLTWRVWQRDHASKPKSDLRREELAQARKDLHSKDLKKSYLAMSTLAELAPTEALKAANKLLEDDALSQDQKNPFYSITARAYENGAVETYQDEPKPEPKPVVKVKSKSKTKTKAKAKAKSKKPRAKD